MPDARLHRPAPAAPAADPHQARSRGHLSCKNPPEGLAPAGREPRVHPARAGRGAGHQPGCGQRNWARVVFPENRVRPACGRRSPFFCLRGPALGGPSRVGANKARAGEPWGRPTARRCNAVPTYAGRPLRRKIQACRGCIPPCCQLKTSRRRQPSRVHGASAPSVHAAPAASEAAPRSPPGSRR
jgi:hypothetical protein